MTLRIIIHERWIYVFREQRFHKTLLLERFNIPYSFEEFQIWYDSTNQLPKKISFECYFTHRKLCMISRKKFESLDFPELPYIKDLMLGKVKDE